MDLNEIEKLIDEYTYTKRQLRRARDAFIPQLVEELEEHLRRLSHTINRRQAEAKRGND